ncbi:aminopeptidase [Tuberibacillus sp. Marseille-P3662]|uniref:aminopeptidase n=1 Tax=Tuberibacillus sp. Marseille-P3662 TaxID=1965358 RepID=UPI000A1C8FBD|nr:aminopeptidase [Tuberibacillus sp. Marseille-P3662]
MQTFDQKLEKYAELAVKIGVNIQKDQDLVVSAPIAAVDFVRKVTKEAYQSGAKQVYFRWSDDELTLTRFQYAPDEAFKEYPTWEAEGLEQLAKEGAAFLDIRTPNLDLLNGIDPEKISMDNKTASKALEPYKEYRMADRVSWSIVAVPSEEWAKKLFPDLETDAAVTELWNTIFKMTRVDREDPIASWEEHQQQLTEKGNYMNNKKFKQLHYRAPGTDLTIELPKDHVWAGGAAEDASGTSFIPNIPTEEIFTLPLKTGVNGTVTSTKPLNYSGTLIENLSLTFEDGRIVDFNADQGYETLKRLIETDEGSHYLGEVALVPHNSPISQSGLIFFNTLFDENASCHLAIGKAYPKCLENGADLSREALEQHGVNNSLVHVDFMIGSDELDIDGITHDDDEEPIFRHGLWAF